MKKLFLALVLCAFVAPAMAADHGHAAKKEEVKKEEMKMEEGAEHADAKAPVAPAKKKKRTAKKATTTTTTTEESAPAETTHD